MISAAKWYSWLTEDGASSYWRKYATGASSITIISIDAEVRSIESGRQVVVVGGRDNRCLAVGSEQSVAIKPQEQFPSMGALLPRQTNDSSADQSYPSVVSSTPVVLEPIFPNFGSRRGGAGESFSAEANL